MNSGKLRKLEGGGGSRAAGTSTATASGDGRGALSKAGSPIVRSGNRS
jgi:hypothetical protein